MCWENSRESESTEVNEFKGYVINLPLKLLYQKFSVIAITNLIQNYSLFSKIMFIIQ